jgi:thioester reductase-like protein
MRMRRSSEPVAITGIGLRLPGGVRDVGSFWDVVSHGVDVVQDVPGERWNHALIYDRDPNRLGKTVARQGGFVDEITRFEPAFFGISKREAEAMDPQHRMLLETAWLAVEDAGITTRELAGSRTGVFVGISTQDYRALQDFDSLSTYTATGQAQSIAANRLSYTFDLRGPSVAIDTACSSSLVAFHAAVESIRRLESESAIVAGVNALLDPGVFIAFSQLGMLSPQNRCKAFDESGNGFVRAEGAVAIYLKAIKKAVRDRDRVYAVVLASGVNQDGRSSGIMMPSVDSQRTLLSEVYAAGGIDRRRVSYVETHGTGTAVGDPSEATALGQVLGSQKSRAHSLVIGSLKTNIGHLEAASGLAGLVKAALVLKHGLIPPNLHFHRPNPKIDFVGLNLRIPVMLEPLTCDGSNTPVVGVNSFGFGGTNAHVALGQVASAKPSRASGRYHVLTVSTHSSDLLPTRIEQMTARLGEAASASDLADLCYTANVRRTHQRHRVAVMGHSIAEIISGLTARLTAPAAPAVDPKVAFLYPGQGCQRPGMGLRLAREFSAFRHAFQQCEELIQQRAGWSLMSELRLRGRASRLVQTRIAQPAIFAFQVSMTELLRTFGLNPAAVIGHSVGEVCAAWSAGVLPIQSAVDVVCTRAEAMEASAAAGSMLAAAVAPERVSEVLQLERESLWLAAINSPTSITLSGTKAAIDRVRTDLQKSEIRTAVLPVGYAFHSGLLDAAEGAMLSGLEHIRPEQAIVPFISTVTGSKISGTECTSMYWWKNVRMPVLYAAAVSQLRSLGITDCVELSPSATLLPATSECLRAEHTAVVATSTRDGSDSADVLRTLAKLFERGHSVNWKPLYRRARRVVGLPVYSWKGEPVWRVSAHRHHLNHAAVGDPLLGLRRLGGVPTWQQLFSTRRQPLLADHVYGEQAVVPASCYVALALAAHVGARQSTAFLENVEFLRPLVVTEHDDIQLETVQCVSDKTIEIRAARPDTHQWQMHARFKTVGDGGYRRPSKRNLGAIRGRLPTILDHERFYRICEAVGLHYGPAFRGVQRVWCSSREALGEIWLERSTASSVEEDAPPRTNLLNIDPALLDACLQVTLGAVYENEWSPPLASAYLPVRITSYHQFDPLPSQLWSHVTVRCFERDCLVADIAICAADGEVLVTIDRFECRPLEQRERGEISLYESEWDAKPLPSSGHVPDDEPATWLLFADGPNGAALLAAMADQGTHAILVEPGLSLARLSPNRFVLNPSVPSDFVKLLDFLPSDTRALLAVYMWGLPATDWALSCDTVERECADGMCGLLHLAQAQAQTPRFKHQMVVITKGAHAVLSTQTVCPTQTGLIGLARVVQTEHRSVSVSSVDLPLDDHIDWQLVAEEVRAHQLGGDFEEIALRGRSRLAHRYRPRTMDHMVESGISRMRLSDCENFSISQRRPKSLQALCFSRTPRRSLRNGELLVEIEAAGLNFSDLMKALGLYPADNKVPLVFGAEYAGTVVDVHETVQRFCDEHVLRPVRQGDRVAGIAPGVFARYSAVPAVYACPIGGDLSWAQAAGMPIAMLTARYALERLAKLSRGERVLIHSAAGGVGQAAVQVARHAGAIIFGTAGSAAKRDYLRANGVDLVMDSRTLDFADEILEYTSGAGVDVVLNSLSGAALDKSLQVLAPYGRFVELGKKDVYEGRPIRLEVLKRNAVLAVLDLEDLLQRRPTDAALLLHDTFKKMDAGVLDPLPVATHPMRTAEDTFRRFSRAEHIGKIVLTKDLGEADVYPAAAETKVRADATYVVTGGLGGFGLALVRWLVKEGARHIAIITRHMPNEDSDLRRGLESLSAAVEIFVADVAELRALEDAFAAIAAAMPHVRGVFHCATTYDDSLLVNQTWPRMQGALRAKAVGAYNLHKLTAGLHLDHFVLFSSISSVVGTRGQASYSAANAVLDGLAHLRSAVGLPCLAVNFGHIGNVGAAARQYKTTRLLERFGALRMEPEDALGTLGGLMSVERQGQYGIARMRWKAAFRNQESAVPARFRELVDHGETRGRGKDETARLVRELLEKGVAERIQSLVILLRREVARVMDVKEDDVDASRAITDLGLDSLMGVELMCFTDMLGCNVSVAELLQGPSISRLAEVIAERLEMPAVARGGGERFDDDLTMVEADSELGSSISVPTHWCGQTRDDRTAPAFLTGGTGFVGSHLLRVLLAETSRDVFCLVRHGVSGAGRDRVIRRLEETGAESNGVEARIRIVEGDLSQPRFGLDQHVYEELSRVVGTVYHAGASVGLLGNYSEFRDTNVLGTAEVVAFCCAGRVKDLHHVSSLAAFDFRPAGQVFDEEQPPRMPRGVAAGYRQSKWAAERVVRSAQKRGLPAVIYRPALICGHSETGAGSSDDILAHVMSLSATLKLGVHLDAPLHIVPVDYVSKAIVRMSGEEHLASPIVHLSCRSPHTVTDYFNWARALGWRLDLVSVDEWVDAVGGSDLPAGQLIDALVFADVGELSDGATWPVNRIDSERSASVLQPLGLVSPDVAADAWQRILEWYRRSSSSRQMLNRASPTMYAVAAAADVSERAGG